MTSLSESPCLVIVSCLVFTYYLAKQIAFRRDCINTDLEMIGVPGFYFVFTNNILTHIDFPARLSHFTRYALTYPKVITQRS